MVVFRCHSWLAGANRSFAACMLLMATLVNWALAWLHATYYCCLQPLAYQFSGIAAIWLTDKGWCAMLPLSPGTHPLLCALHPSLPLCACSEQSHQSTKAWLACACVVDCVWADSSLMCFLLCGYNSTLTFRTCLYNSGFTS